VIGKEFVRKYLQACLRFRAGTRDSRETVMLDLDLPPSERFGVKRSGRASAAGHDAAPQ